jgi:hypothetical protein
MTDTIVLDFYFEFPAFAAIFFGFADINAAPERRRVVCK